MKFLIISHTEHYHKNNKLFAYAPYVREMNLWLKKVNKVEIIAPLSNNFDNNINLAYQHQNIKVNEVPAFSILSFKGFFSAIINLPGILKNLFYAMKRADHIHLRCPGNMGLLGCIVQIFFPSKPKTTKYAGNWNPKATQPWSYNLQKWILKNTFLTKNMKVLVYGNWPDQSKNIIPFFTASYHQSEIEELYVRNYKKPLHFCFIGSLSRGKQPDLALKFVQKLINQGVDAVLHIYGDGKLKEQLKNEIKEKKAENWAFIYGNQPKHQIKKALKYSHFLILPSKSEGWPKAVAEAMFWGCIPIATPVSCVSWMLHDGERGFLLNADFNKSINEFQQLLDKPLQLEKKSKEAAKWSRQYTLDGFEAAIHSILHK